MSIILTAAGALPSLTNGAADIAQSETSTNKQNDAFIDFAAGTTSYAEWSVLAPDLLLNNRAFFNVFWTTTSASTNSVVFGLQARAFSASDPIDSAYGTAVEVTDANRGANLMNISATAPPATGGAPIFTAPFVVISNFDATIAPTSPGHGLTMLPPQLLKFRLYRLGSGADTLAATARVSMVRVCFGLAAGY
jgi:hypothetical protein